MLTWNYYGMVQDLIYKFSSNLMAQSHYSITYMNELATRLASTLYSDTNVNVFLHYPARDNMKSIIASLTLRQHLLPLPYVESVYLYNGTIDLLYSTKDGGQYTLDRFYDSEMAEYLRNPEFLKEQQGAPIIHEVDYYGSVKQVCSYVLYEAASENKLSNALVINISTDTLIQSLQTLNQFNQEIKFLVTDGQGKLIGPSPFSSADTTQSFLDAFQKLQPLEESGTKSQFITIEGVRYLLIYDKRNDNNWAIMSAVPNNKLLEQVFSRTAWSVGIAVLVFSGAAFLCLLLAKWFNKPLQAVTQVAQNNNTDSIHLPARWKEFQFLADTLTAMREQNRQLDQLYQETVPSMKQDFLISLTADNRLDTRESCTHQLKMLNLSYLETHTLCMCLLQIDSYQRFCDINNEKQRWALRYAVVNVAAEIFSHYVTCEVFPRDTDKFIILIDCAEQEDYHAFTLQLELILHEILIQISENLDFTLTAVYGNFFHGLDHLSRMYENLTNLLQLKIQYGGNQIITPQMVEDAEYEELDIPKKLETEIVSAVLEGNYQEACLTYDKMSEMLSHSSYSEIIPYFIQLGCFVWEAVRTKYPSLKSEGAQLLKQYLDSFRGCERAEEYHAQFKQLLVHYCEAVQRIREHSAQQNTELIVQRIKQIVADQLSHKDLCLNSIAEEIGLSANYVGRVFKAAENKSVSKYISDIRMEKIALYLDTTHYPIDKIIDLVGMEKTNYFYTNFKKHFGISLKEYRSGLHKAVDSQ